MKLDWSGKATAKGDGHLNSQRFADDIILFSESANEPQQLINDMNTERLKVGLKITGKRRRLCSTAEFRSNRYMHKATR